jgi:hypothetical protein
MRIFSASWRAIHEHGYRSRAFVHTVGLACRVTPIAVVASLVLLAEAAPAGAYEACDPTLVVQTGTTIRVKPTGTDDTANLQCAIDTAILIGPGVVLQLEQGTYRTSQLVATGFEGVLTGAGSAKTVLVNRPELAVAETWAESMPSSGNPWPSLLAFVNGDFTVSNLAIRITGQQPVTGLGPLYTALNDVIAVVGERASARFDRLLVEGEQSQPLDPSWGFGSNVNNGIYFHGACCVNDSPLGGLFQVTKSTIRDVGDGLPTSNLRDADVVLAGNVLEPTFSGASTTALLDTRYELSSNDITLKTIVSYAGFYYYGGGENSRSTLLIKDNKVRGYMGMSLEQQFDSGMQCRLQANNVTETELVGIYLGVGTTGCTVVGGPSKTSVVDDGTGNVLVGVNSMGSGVGPAGGGNR